MGRYSVVLVISRFLLIFIAANHLEVIRSEDFRVYLLDAVDELNGGSVAVFGEEGDGDVSRFYCF